MKRWRSFRYSSTQWMSTSQGGGLHSAASKSCQAMMKMQSINNNKMHAQRHAQFPIPGRAIKLWKDEIEVKKKSR